MARKNSVQQEVPPPVREANRAEGRDAALGNLSKTEMVRRALAELGNGAMPGAIQEFVKDHFGKELDRNLISGYKHTLTRGKKKKVGRRGGHRHSKAGPRALASAGNGTSRVTISLADLQALKELTTRVAADDLRALIDMLAW